MERLFQRGVLSMGLRTGLVPKLQEGRMRRFAVRLLALAICTPTLVMVAVAAPAKAETSHRHLKRHGTRVSGTWSAGQPGHFAEHSGQAGEVCPGIARSFDCAGPWPPPINDDPDRKIGSDGN